MVFIIEGFCGRYSICALLAHGDDDGPPWALAGPVGKARGPDGGSIDALRGPVGTGGATLGSVPMAFCCVDGRGV